MPQEPLLFANAGINLDATPSQLKQGQLTYALNAVINSQGESFTYQNEASNHVIFTFSSGFYIIGEKYIPEKNVCIFFLTNPDNKISEIGIFDFGADQYQPLMNSKCLNFNLDYPVRAEVKITNCNTEIYFTDNYNPRRYFNLNKLPVTGTNVDCNKLLVQPDFSIPNTQFVEIQTGGDLQYGAYQFGVQYSNALGEGYTQYYGICNPVNIYERKFQPDHNSFSSKSIIINIVDLDTTGLFEYYNLAVIATINNVTKIELVGTYKISAPIASHNYTGHNKSQLRLAPDDIFVKYPYYSTAKDIAVADGCLLWAGLTKTARANYQEIWSKVILYWESYRLKYSQNDENNSKYRPYLGDEVYSYYGVFILRNGEITEKCHIPNRLPTDFDLEIIDNQDSKNSEKDSCKPAAVKHRWQVYNTASVIGFSKDYLNNQDSCYEGPYQYGYFGYYQSSEKYPDNKWIYGELAGQPIRMHRFPESDLSPLFDDNKSGDLSYQHYVYHKGVKIDENSLYNAINSSNLSDQEKDDIVGFKIVRANRAGAKTVIAKGLTFNIGKYNYQGNSFYYPNYPLNDLRPDPFLAGSKVKALSGTNTDKRLDGFSTQDSKLRFTFHSPSTSFYQPFITGASLQVESVFWGKSFSHFVEVKDNARYKFLTQDAIRLAFSTAMSSIITLTVGGGFGVQPFQANAGLQLSGVLPSFASTLEVIKNITPALNYSFSFNLVGNFCNSTPVPQAGNKIRNIDVAAYLSDGMQNIGDNLAINNIRRESSVFLRLTEPLPFPHELAPVPADDSRHIMSMGSCEDFNTIHQRNTCALYCSIKKQIPDMYYGLNTVDIVDTGIYFPLYDKNGQKFEQFRTIFGGDTFISRFGLKRKLSFFLDNSVNKADGTDINLDDLSNIGYPIFFYSTKPVDIDADLSGLEDDIRVLTDTGFWTIVGNLVSGGTRPLRSGFRILLKLFKAYLEVLSVNNVNMDCPGTKNMNRLGKIYQFAYGIPYFFVESEIDVEKRTAINPAEGNYYPHVSSGIPDDWLQESFVPIIHDNSYTYNKTYSKQNKEAFYPSLRPDYDPGMSCLTNYENRIIYSEKSNMEETRNSWLIYRPASYHDLPKDYGPLCGIDGLGDNSVLVRFYNNSFLYNVYSKIETNTGVAYLGNSRMFSQPPLPLGDSVAGFAGSQNNIILKTPYGTFFTDSIRGQVILLQKGGIQDLASKDMHSFFKAHLPFEISKFFPVNTDNAYKDFGITAAYDNFLNRLIISKKDYRPITDISYVDGKFFHKGLEVHLDDESCFCNVSWTLSYSFLSQSWISFHSYQPDLFISCPSTFHSCNKGALALHPGEGFLNYHGKNFPYILEYPILNYSPEGIISSITDYTSVLKQISGGILIDAEDEIYFNNAIIYNNSQTSGLLELVPKPGQNLSRYFNYPIVKEDRLIILFSKSANLFNFNTFSDIVSDKSKPFLLPSCSPQASNLKLANIDYRLIKSFNRSRLRSRESRLRLIYNSASNYKLVTRFISPTIQISFK